MPIDVLVTSQKFYNEYKNGIGFGSVLTDFTPNLTGSVMEKVKFVQQVDVSWKVQYTAPNGAAADFAWTFTFAGNQLTIVRDSGNFKNDGFSLGDNVDIYWFTTSLTTYSGDILAISPSGDLMLVDMGATTSFPTGVTSVTIFGDSPLEALVYNFGLIENGDTFNTISAVSGNSQGYYAAGIGLDTGGGVRDTSFVNMTRLGVYKDWQTGSSRVRFVSNPAAFVQRFEIEHEFMIVPYYLDGQLSNLQNGVIPPILTGANSLKYVYKSSFRTTLSNPNTEKEVIFEDSLGAVAWFNENFSGFQNDYTITSVTYEEANTAAPTTGILIGGETKIKVTVDRNSGLFVGAERFGAYISYLPEQNEYQNTTISDLTQNFIYDRALNSAGLPSTSSSFITGLTATVVAGSLEIEIITEYLPLQQSFLAQKFQNTPTYFMLGIEVGDNTLSSGNSDRVMLLADVELYSQSADIFDLMHVTKFDIFPHEKQIGVDTGNTDVTVWNEDGLVVDFEFDVNLNLDAYMNSLDFILVAYNTVTGQYWEIDKYSFSPATSVVSGGVQQVIESSTRNYILRSGDQFNDVTINVGSQAAGLQNYSGRYAQKISWQDWLLNLDVDTIFFDANEPNNNFNDKSSNYSMLNNYEIRLGVFSNLSGTSPLGVSGLTNYLFLSPNIRVYDYEEDGNPTPIWSCVIETFDATGTISLGGSILTGQNTLFRATWTNSGGPVTSLANIYGINRIEETGQAGYDIIEMSSINLPLPAGQQILEASVGSLLDLTLVGGNVVMECLIDGALVISGFSYNLSSTIRDTLQVTEGKETESGVSKDTETSIQKVIE